MVKEQDKTVVDLFEGIKVGLKGGFSCMSERVDRTTAVFIELSIRSKGFPDDYKLSMIRIIRDKEREITDLIMEEYSEIEEKYSAMWKGVQQLKEALE